MKPSDKENNSFFKRDYHHLLLYFILVIGAIFRIYGFWDWSLTNDELSALSRLTVDSLSELIDQGIKPDGHPAVTQLFLYYWVKVFGDSVFVVRFPFVISGIGSLFFFYLAAKNWLNKKAALLASIVFACSQFLILYAQIARPYAFGLFFLMAFNYYWTQLIFQKKKETSHSFGFILFAALGIMTHYFATLSIMIQLFLGVFLLSKKDVKQYLIYLAITALLCLPHLGISLQHLQIGGLGWLPQPSSDFYGKFIQFSFNHSTLWISLIALGIALPFVSKSIDIKWKRVIAILPMAFLPFWIGYEYSINFSPVLQRSVLIFSFPFLILLFFSLIGEKLKPQLLIAYYTLLLVVGVYSLIKTDILNEKPFANFKSVTKNVIEWKEKYGEQLLSLSNANNPYYFNYYLSNNLINTLFAVNKFRSSKEVVKAMDLIKKTDKEYISLSFGVFPVPLEVYELAKKEFPEVIEQNRYYISEAILLGKGDKKRKIIFETKALNKNSENWKHNKLHITDSSFYSPPNAYHLKSKEEYPLSYKSEVGAVSSEKNRWINTEFYFKSQDTCNLTLVVDVSRNDESYYWRGFETKAFYRKGEWSHFIAVWERPGFVKDDDDISIFIWNLNHCNCMLDEFSIRNFADSDYNFY
jgi:hypothetical protein